MDRLRQSPFDPVSASSYDTLPNIKTVARASASSVSFGQQLLNMQACPDSPLPLIVLNYPQTKSEMLDSDLPSSQRNMCQ